MKKGISPLVAAVLLIGITMIIAGFLAFWVSTFMRGRATTFEKTTEEIEKCTRLQAMASPFNIYYSSYNSSTKTLRLFLENRAGIEYKIAGIDIFYPNESTEWKDVNLTLPAIPRIVSMEFTIGGPDDCTKYRIVTECVNVTREGSC